MYNQQEHQDQHLDFHLLYINKHNLNQLRLLASDESQPKRPSSGRFRLRSAQAILYLHYSYSQSLELTRGSKPDQFRSVAYSVHNIYLLPGPRWHRRLRLHFTFSQRTGYRTQSRLHSYTCDSTMCTQCTTIVHNYKTTCPKAPSCRLEMHETKIRCWVEMLGCGGGGGKGVPGSSPELGGRGFDSR